MPRLGARGGLGLPAHLQRELGGAFLTSMVTEERRRRGPRGRLRPARRGDRRGDLRREHDDAQLRALAHRRARLAAGRRGHRDAARPRREHRSLARARRRQAADRPLLRARRRVPPRPRPPALARSRRGRGSSRSPGPRTRVGTVTPVRGDRRARPRGRRARLGRRRALRPPRRHRGRRGRRRRAALLALQVLRAPPRASPTAAASCSSAGAPTRSAPRATPPGSATRPGTLPHELLCGFIAAGRVPARRRLGVHHDPRDARSASSFLDGLPARLDAPRAADDGRARADLRAQPARRAARGGRGAAWRGGLRGLARQLLRGRGDGAPRPPRGRRADRHRPHEHRGRGRAPARGAPARTSGRARAARRSTHPLVHYHRAVAVFERSELANGAAAAVGAAAPRPVGRLLRHARGRLALRARRQPRHRPLRRAHVLQGHRAPPELARPDDADRRDRRRVQRLHLEGVHRLLRPLRRRRPRHRASTSCSTCSATRSSTPRRSSARRA